MHLIFMFNFIKSKKIKEVTPFLFNRDDFKNGTNDWLAVEKIEIVEK